ncbi:MAG TPA: ABC transporter ATP-binding protein [Clostridiaceae bacterium]|nr:ABC transporter ATP-binding protein [Clostridiaceae bacterium]
MENNNNIKNICLKVRDLKTSFFLNSGRKVQAVKDVSFDLYEGETLGIVGESGSGKSVMVKSILKLITPPGKIEYGSVIFNGRDLIKTPEKDMLNVRGREISMIFQEPLSALNPSFTIGWQIGEAFRLHGKYSKKEIYNMTLEALQKVSIPDPEKRINEYPHQFSGGMRQRVLIAIALACNPKILIADEPTTALDVTVQADIMDLLDELREKSNISIILISHNLNMVTERSDRIIVVYAGSIQEIATSEEIVQNPLHPYTVGLMNSLPNIAEEGQKLTAIPGELPDLTIEIKGCSFAPRCAFATERCSTEAPELYEISPGHFCRCHLFSDSARLSGGV